MGAKITKIVRLATIAVAAASLTLSNTLPAGAATSTQSIAVPAYSYPSWFVTPFWQNIQSASSKVPFVILNPASGPGTSSNSDYQAQIDRNTAAGIRSIGYVDTLATKHDQSLTS